jgi:hypothetical protein
MRKVKSKISNFKFQILKPASFTFDLSRFPFIFDLLNEAEQELQNLHQLFPWSFAFCVARLFNLPADQETAAS